MAFSTRLGPHRQGTVKEGSGANCGLPILVQTATVAYTNTTAKNLFILPAGSQVLSVIVDVTTAFDSSGTDLLDIGTTASGALYVNDLDVSSTGHNVCTLVAANLASILNVGTSDVTVTATYAQSVADAANGAATVTVLYIQRNPDGTVTVAP